MNGLECLEWLRARRSVRAFGPRPIERAVLVRVLEAAITAPSSTNRQPWRFAAVTRPALRTAIVDAVRRKTEALKEIVGRSHHAEEFGNYGDFFFEPLQTAAAIVVPQFRELQSHRVNFCTAEQEVRQRSCRTEPYSIRPAGTGQLA